MANNKQDDNKIVDNYHKNIKFINRDNPIYL